DKVQKRWRSLRDKLVRLLRDMKKTSTSGAGADDVEDPMSWPHFEQMYFVRDTLQHRRFHVCMPLVCPFGLSAVTGIRVQINMIIIIITRFYGAFSDVLIH
ncbi:uncharacterized protein ISCGN_006376, partial [Ixodes scapularis]